MIKNAAVFLAFVLVFILFQPQIKAGIAHLRFTSILSGLEIESEQDEALRSIRDRIGDGIQKRVFTDKERLTLAELRVELAEIGKAEEAPPKAAVDSVIGRFEAILGRHGL